MKLINIQTDGIIGRRGPQDVEITGACSDSREVRNGWLFCAMKGARMDGHAFISQALKNGASAIAAEDISQVPNDVPCIQITDAYRTLGLIAEAIAEKPADSFPLIAVTGTNGKTTTAYLLRDILKHANAKPAMIGTVEYDIASGKPLEADRTTPTPFQLQSLFSQIKANGASHTVIEASSHSLEQGRLGTAKCKIAIFTNLTQDHLDYHINMENYYQAKKLLFTKYLADGGKCIINADDPSGARLVQELKDKEVLAFSFENSPFANVLIKDIEITQSGSSFTLILPKKSSASNDETPEAWKIKTPLTGNYNAANTAGAAIAAYALGVSKETVISSLAQAQGAPGRLQSVPVPGNTFSIFVDYAHTDDALKNVLSNLKRLPHNRLIVVFGCGGDRDRKKRPLMGRVANNLADIVYVTSDNPRTENPDDIIREILTGFPESASPIAIADRRTAIKTAIANAKPQDIILIAGKGHEDYQEINGVKHHFNDAEVAAESLCVE